MPLPELISHPLRQAGGTLTELTGDVARAVRKRGAIGFLRHQTRQRWNRLVYPKIAVWEWRPEWVTDDAQTLRNFANVRAGESIQVTPLRAWTDVSAATLAALIAEDGMGLPERLRAEFAAEGTLWVATLGGRPAGYVWSRPGDRVPRWNFPLEAESRLLFSCVTLTQYRNRGVATTLLRTLCRQAVPTSGRAVGECRIWNAPSMQVFAKADFRRLSDRRPHADYVD